ncbi:MAG: carbohydrate binding domain-containing protein [Ruminococcus sp.]|nr:carbohydrate binding domain-containing protein [Ruminococcus sp.]
MIEDNFSGNENDDPPVVDPGEEKVYFHDTFESGAGDWTGRGAAKVAASNTAYEGSGSIYVSGRTSAWNGASRALGSDFEAGKAYSFSANVMFDSGSASDTFYLKLQYKDSSGETKYEGIAEAETIKGAWVQLTNTNYKLPAGATDMQIYVETPDSTNDFYVDDVYGASAGSTFNGAGGSKRLSRGDVDYDGRISVFDVTIARQLLTGQLNNAAASKAADADGNGKVEVNDLVLIYEFVMGKITSFPTPPKPDNPWDDYKETASQQYINFYQSGICNMGNTYRLANKLESAEAGGKLTLAYLGGSITEGKNYSKPFTEFIKNNFAKGTFKEVNAGLSGTSSVVGLVRSEKDIVSQNPDIIVIEFSVNDHEGEMYKKSFESLVKKFLSLPNEPAVIVLITSSKGGYSSQEQMEKIGKCFDVPVISMNNALSKAFSSGFLKKEDYFSDEYHPHAKGGQLMADVMSYYVRQAMKTENRSDSYEIPNKSVYGSEYSTCINANPQTDLQNFNAGSFKAGSGYSSLPYGYTSSGGAPMTFKAKGKGLIIVFKANSKDMGSINVTVNGKTTKVNGVKQYTWGGPDAELGYFQTESGDLDVSISASGNFTIWGIGLIK